MHEEKERVLCNGGQATFSPFQCYCKKHCLRWLRKGAAVYCFLTCGGYKHVQNVSCFTCGSNSHTSRRSLLIRWSENTVLKISLSDWQKNLSRNSFDLSLTGKQKLSWGHIWTINSEKHPLKTPNHRVLHRLQPVVTYRLLMNWQKVLVQKGFKILAI